MSHGPNRRDACIGFRPDVHAHLAKLAGSRSLASVVNEACIVWLRAHGVEVSDEWEPTSPAEVAPAPERHSPRRRPHRSERQARPKPPTEEDAEVAQALADAPEGANAAWVRKYIREKKEGKRK